MQQKILALLETYCNTELADFRRDKLYRDLHNITNDLGYRLVSEYGTGETKEFPCNVYLSISVYNQNNEAVEIYDEGFLSAATELIAIDKKERIRFYSWHDEDFVDSIHWMIRMLQKTEDSNDG